MSQEKIAQEKIKRKALPQKLRALVWNEYIGKAYGMGKCWCCKNKSIEQMDFQCGHVESVKVGGTDDISNLRPICAPCNLSMGTMNMIEFMKKIGTCEKELTKNSDATNQKFVCEFCEIGFANSSNLSRHKKLHCLVMHTHKSKEEKTIQNYKTQIKKLKVSIKDLEKQLEYSSLEIKTLSHQLEFSSLEIKTLSYQLDKKNAQRIKKVNPPPKPVNYPPKLAIK